MVDRAGDRGQRDSGKGGSEHSTEVVLAIDPGREKSGIALVRSDASVAAQRVVTTDRLLEELENLAAGGDQTVSAIVLGDRTGSKATRRRLREAGWEQRCPIVLVDEHRSSDEARQRYWRDHPPRGLGRMLPTSLQTPPEAYDDYVAVILAKRYFAARSSKVDSGA